VVTNVAAAPGTTGQDKQQKRDPLHQHKEAEDIVAAGRFLAAQPGVSSIGLVGFSLGGQDTVLALALDRKRVFSAGLNFSGPADQATQVDSTAVPSGCETPACAYPATDALTALVVPPYDYTDACTVLDYAATYYATDPSRS
jgi:dienelactone hydrolase